MAAKSRASVTPQTRNFVIQRIDGLPEQYVSPPPEVLERIKRDAYAVGEARARDTDEMWFADKFIWPTDGPISSIYGSQRILNGEPREPHYGVDIAAPEGAPIRAPVGGIVTLAQELYLSGNTMVIDHGHGVSTSYLHMSRIDVKVGDRLNQGRADRARRQDRPRDRPASLLAAELVSDAVGCRVVVAAAQRRQGLSALP